MPSQSSDGVAMQRAGHTDWTLAGRRLSGDTYRFMATSMYCTALCLGGLCVNIVGPAGPSLAVSVHARATLIGNIFAAEGAGNTLGSSVASMALARVSGHPLIGSLCLLLFVVVGLIPSCTSGLQVIALYVIIGAALGLIGSVANTLITWVHAGHNLGPWVNLINSSYGLGASTAALIFLAADQRMGNGLAAFSMVAFFAAFPAALAFALPSPSAPPPSQPDDKDQDESAHPLRGIGVSHSTSTIAGIDLGSRAAYVRVTVVGPLMAAVLIVIGAEIAFAGWIYAYAVDRVGMGQSDAAYLASLFWGTFTAGRLCTIPLAAFFSPGALLVPTMLLEVCSMLLIIGAPGSATALWVGTVGAGVGVCALYSNVLSLLASYELLTSSTVSAIAMAAAMGHMTVPNLVGVAIHSTQLGYDVLIWICATADVVGLALVTAVVLHLHSHFTPTFDSVQGRLLRHRRQLELEGVAEQL
jgi:FHS family Na+ dependent glucose MFS transporter 1